MDAKGGKAALGFLAAAIGAALLFLGMKKKPVEPSQLLLDLHQALNEAYIAVEAGYPDDWVMVPGYGLTSAINAVSMIPPMMVNEAINIGLIESSTDVYFIRDHMYYKDGTQIV